ncbi:MAG: Lysine exporter protein, partial [Deltaproteobacteria bacterium]|nr:Lysine exporter protein [Deltaproteobacteria bacterium]
LGVMSPGPDFIMCVRNSLMYSRKTGVFTAVGFSLGVAVHVTYLMAGIAVIIAKSPTLFAVIKYFGAAYLLYMGIRSIAARSFGLDMSPEKTRKDISPLNAVWIGFLTNISNPKATLFFLGLFTLVIRPGTPGFVLIIAGIIMVLETVLWFSFVAFFLNQRHVRSLVDRFQGYFNLIFGILLIVISLRIAFFPD